MSKKRLILFSSIMALLLAAITGAWAMDRVDFYAPLWLLAGCLIPFAAYMAWHSVAGLPDKTNFASLLLRSILLVLVVLALADPQIVRTNDSTCVIYILDHSASIPSYIHAQQLKFVNESAETKDARDTSGIIVFGDSASMELMPTHDSGWDAVKSFVNKDFTNIESAIELATAAFPADVRKKIVLLTDGNENKGQMINGIKLASGNGIITDILPVDYQYKEETMVEKVRLPDRIKEGETFDLKVHVNSLTATPGTLTIFRNGEEIAVDDLHLKAGENIYTVSLKVDEPGFYAFSARITTEKDTIVQNNEASSYVYIQGESRVLFVAPTGLEVQYLIQACKEEKLETDYITPEALPESLAMLQNYDCVVLANVGAEYFGDDQMEMLEASVRDLGVGFVMIGGEDGFGAGGYEGTPIEKALPVTMDIKQKKINPKGALAIVLHTCEFANGNWWAKQITKKAIETVNAQDDVGVLYYGYRGGDEWLFPLQPAENKNRLYRLVDGCNPGDMPSFAPTMALAAKAFKKSDAMIKHMIIISDGDPGAPQTKDVNTLVAAGVTVSTVAINPHSPRDVDVMKYIAQKTGGRYYFANNPNTLPQIFVKEAKVVKRSLIFNQKFQPILQLSTEVTKGIKADEIPPLYAYVATTPKPRATVPIVSDNENADPILAYWRYGLGKTVAFTSDATSNWGKDWVEWSMYKKTWTQIIRWASRKRQKSNLRMRTETDGTRGKLLIDAIDQKGQFENFLQLNGRLVTPDMNGTELEIRQVAPGRYEAEFDASEVGVSILNVGYRNDQTGAQGFIASGVSVPYSPEFKHLQTNIAKLRSAAKATGGKLLSGNAREEMVYKNNIPPTRSLSPFWEWLLLFALLSFFADVIIRRVIITREDVAMATAAMKGIFVRTRNTEADATMAALIERKKKTHEQMKASGFKAKLDEQAARTPPPKGASATSRNLVRQAREEAPKPVRPAAPKSDQKAAAKPEEGSTYTSRLLAAKKRAQREKQIKPEDDV